VGKKWKDGGCSTVPTGRRDSRTEETLLMMMMMMMMMNSKGIL
jgi:hypothetical protein